MAVEVSRKNVSELSIVRNEYASPPLPLNSLANADHLRSTAHERGVEILKRNVCNVALGGPCDDPYEANLARTYSRKLVIAPEQPGSAAAARKGTGTARNPKPAAARKKAMQGQAARGQVQAVDCGPWADADRIDHPITKASYWQPRIAHKKRGAAK